MCTCRLLVLFIFLLVVSVLGHAGNVSKNFVEGDDELLAQELLVSSASISLQKPPGEGDNAIAPISKPPSQEPPLRAPSIFNPTVINIYFNEVIPAYFSIVQKCSDMRFYIGTLIDRIRRGASMREFEEYLIGACVLNQQPRPVCVGLIKRFAPTFYFITKKRPKLTADIATGIVFQHAGCTTNDTYVEYEVEDSPGNSTETDWDNSETDYFPEDGRKKRGSTTTLPTTFNTSTHHGTSPKPTVFPPRFFKDRVRRGQIPNSKTTSRSVTTINPSTKRRRRTTTPKSTGNILKPDDLFLTTKRRRRTTTPDPEEYVEETTKRKSKRTTTSAPHNFEFWPTTKKPRRTTTPDPDPVTDDWPMEPEAPYEPAVDENDEYDPGRPPVPPIKILHLTDIHVDPLYVPGSNAACDNSILCCHAGDGTPNNRSVVAGPYGHGLSCGTPYRTLESALKYIQDYHSDIDMVYMTGDLVPHNLWYTSRSENTDVIQSVSDVIRRYLPDKVIIPMLGNHEPHTADMFSPENVPEVLSTQWIYQATLDAWIHWIPDGAQEDYLKHGYYAVQVTRDLRLLLINTNHCFDFNFWQLYTFKNLREQLQWLQQQLQEAQDQGEFVHIIGHVPPGYQGCSKTFSRHFYNIVTNYSSTIRAQFFGHQHQDTFKAYYTDDKSEPANIQWITPAVTPYNSNNPSIRIYYADPFNYDIVEHETYLLDLERANALGEAYEPEWYKSYTATEAYDLPDLSRPSMEILLDKLAKDPIVFNQYYRHFKKAADRYQAGKCESYCKRRILCRLVRPYYQYDEDCDRLQKKIDGSVLPIYDSLGSY